MTFFCLIFALSDRGIPVWLVAFAMLCDTILLSVGMATGILYFPKPAVCFVLHKARDRGIDTKKGPPE